MLAAPDPGGRVRCRVVKERPQYRVIDRITGTVLVGFGLKLALEPGH